MRKKLLFAFFALSFFLGGGFLNAQTQVSISSEPEFPSPFETVVLKLNSYSFDVNTSVISWRVSGKIVSSGVGQKSISVVTGGIGESLSISAEVRVPSGEFIDVRTVITPQSVDLLWEAVEGYLPPFYEGRSLPGEGSSLRIVAMPNMGKGGKQISSSELSYLWYLNDKFVESASGYGKQSILFKLDAFRKTNTIKVRVRAPSDQEASKTISVSPHAILPLIYEYDPIYGIKRQGTVPKRFEVTGVFTFSLEPYYLSTKNIPSSPSYTWLLDGIPITPPEKTFLSFQPEENSSGVKNLSISINNPSRVLQKAQTAIEILFDTRK